MVRIPLAADDSLAAIRARSRFGIAIAAMIRMIATTISSSISEKPFCFLIFNCPRLQFGMWLGVQLACTIALRGPEFQVTEVICLPKVSSVFSAQFRARVTPRYLLPLPE